MSLRKLAAGAAVAGLVLAFAPSADAAFCRYFVVSGRAFQVCVPIEP
jgi:hypothetical protein